MGESTEVLLLEMPAEDYSAAYLNLALMALQVVGTAITSAQPGTGKAPIRFPLLIAGELVDTL